MIRLSHLVCIASIVVLIGSACAQGPVETLNVPVANDSSIWPRYGVPKKVSLVTLAEPKVRRKCHVTGISEEAITCGSGRRAAVYRRDDIAAIIEPGSHTAAHVMLTVLAVGSGFIAASFFVPELPLAVFMRVLGGAMILMDAGAGIADNGDHGEVVIYQRPGTELAVKLRY